MQPPLNATSRNKILVLKKYASKLLRNKQLLPTFRIPLLQIEKEAASALSAWSTRDKEISKNAKRLQIGGGKRYLDGFVNLDMFPPADLLWDTRYGLPFSDQQFEFIVSEHFLEHLDYPISVNTVLSEVFRVLKPKGKLLLSVPHGRRVIAAYINNDKKFQTRLLNECYQNRNPKVEINGAIDLINYLFRDQFENPDYSVHYWAYDTESLSNLLKKHGFSTVQESSFDSRYCNPKREFYSLYIEAIK